MDNYLKFILVFIASAIISFLFTKIIIYLAHKYKILDYPKDERKIHKKPIPLLGGLAIYSSFLLTVLFLYFQGNLLDERMNISMIFSFLISGLILMIFGYLDDRYTLPAKLSILGPVLAISIVVLFGNIKVSFITGLDNGIMYLDYFYFIPYLISFIWLLGMTYTTKLLDGIDGLTSSIGLIASFIIFFVSLSWDVTGSTTSLMSLALAGSIFGFLILNWNPAKVFLGEGGSVFIGFSLGVLSIISGSKIATALLVMAFPILDIIYVVFNRIKNKKKIWVGDREHLHFRLLDIGLSQKKVVLFMSSIGLIFGLVSVFFTTKAKVSALFILLLLMLLLSSFINSKLKRNENI